MQIMNFRLLATLWLVVFCCFGNVAFAQDDAETEQVQQLTQQLEVEKERVRALAEALNRVGAENASGYWVALSDEEKNRYSAAWVDHQIKLMQVTEAAFDWQQEASDWMLLLVFIVVVPGIIFSGYQLYHSVKLDQPMATTELEASAQKIRVTSSTVGIIILVISIVFVTLFIYEVFSLRPL